MKYLVRFFIGAMITIPHISQIYGMGYQPAWSDGEAQILKQLHDARRLKLEQETARKEILAAQQLAAKLLQEKQLEEIRLALALQSLSVTDRPTDTDTVTESAPHVIPTVELERSGDSRPAGPVATSESGSPSASEILVAAMATKLVDDAIASALNTLEKDRARAHVAATAITGEARDEKKEAKTAHENDTEDTDKKEDKSSEIPGAIPTQAVFDIEQNNWEALFKTYKEPEIIKFFQTFEDGTQFDKPDGRTSMYPIHYAASRGWKNLVAFLISKKVRVTVIARKTGCNALHYTMLIDEKNDPDNKLCGHITHLLLVACNDNTDFVNCKARIKCTTKNEPRISYSNPTPLFLAVSCSCKIAIPLLLQSGASMYDAIPETNHGRRPPRDTTPWRLAKSNAHYRENIFPLFEEFARKNKTA